MTKQEAIKILKEYVELDRAIRDVKDYTSDFDEFCEEKCVAIETLIKCVENNTENER